MSSEVIPGKEVPVHMSSVDVLDLLRQAFYLGVGIDADRENGTIKLKFKKTHRDLAVQLKARERDVCNWLHVFDHWPGPTVGLIRWFTNKSFPVDNDDLLVALLDIGQMIKMGPEGPQADGLAEKIKSLFREFGTKAEMGVANDG